MILMEKTEENRGFRPSL